MVFKINFFQDFIIQEFDEDFTYNYMYVTVNGCAPTFYIHSIHFNVYLLCDTVTYIHRLIQHKTKFII